ncbi:uncharacterized protein LOC131946782 isoform X2 [Physella acuta]|nr:uncharacterized protein LOC131946782 isoform X2 [Physella acuta]
MSKNKCRKSRSAKIVKKLKTASHKDEDSENSSCLLDLENQNDIELLIEGCNDDIQALKQLVVKKEETSKLQFYKENNNQNTVGPNQPVDLQQNDLSVEIARKSVEPCMKSNNLFQWSPPVRIEYSDDESLDGTPAGSKIHLTDEVNKDNASETGWVTVSSRQRKTETFSTAAESKKETASSVYVYDLVSTYTYGSGDSSSTSSKPALMSPHVKMKKLKPRLNSTTYRNKNDIGMVEFPPSLSPINTEKTPTVRKLQCARSIRKLSESCPTRRSKTPKCSTMLWMSDSNTQTMEQLGFSTIPQSCYQSKTSLNLTTKKEIQPLAAECTQPVIKMKMENQQANVMKTSTPESNRIPVSFDISPIEIPTLNDSEFGFPCQTSTEAVTDEIIVPSLLEPSVLSIDSQHNKLCNDINDLPKVLALASSSVLEQTGRETVVLSSSTPQRNVKKTKLSRSSVEQKERETVDLKDSLTTQSVGPSCDKLVKCSVPEKDIHLYERFSQEKVEDSPSGCSHFLRKWGQKGAPNICCINLLCMRSRAKMCSKKSKF